MTYNCIIINLNNHYLLYSNNQLKYLKNENNEKKKDQAADEGTTGGAHFRFPSFTHRLIEDIELVKSLKGFGLRAAPSKVMAVLVKFRPIRRYLPKKSNLGISACNFAHR